MKWEEDADWSKLFTEGGEINETCKYSWSVVLATTQRSALRLAKILAALVGTRDSKLEGFKDGR